MIKHRHPAFPLFLLFLLLLAGGCSRPTHTVWLDELEIQSFSESIRPVHVNTSYSRDTIRIGGGSYKRGLGVQSISVLSFNLKGNATHFKATVGADDSANKDIPIRFYVLGDKKILFESGEMRPGDSAKEIDLDISGVQRFGLLVTDEAGGYNNKGTNGNWANAQLTLYNDHLPQLIPNDGERYLLTPPPGKAPRINSAGIFGATPGYPFLYTIAATGKRPMTFTAENLPAGLSLDSATGIITGTVMQRGDHTVTLRARNAAGEATKMLRIKIGDTIALTPPIGWNGWNSWSATIDQEKVLASAHAMKKKGLSDHGWVYINIDDTWQGKRGGPLNALQPNEKFPAFKEMVDEIHSLGLKAGLYSTPYAASYAGYPGASSAFPRGGETHEYIKKNGKPSPLIGKYRFEKNDARQMAEWGFDFLKYDWRIDVNSAERMSEALRGSGRDIVYSLSNSAPFKQASDWMRLANMYRTGPDIRDSWTTLYLTTFTLDRWAPYGGPGHWNDPDMMIVGNVTTGSKMHPTRLTPDEQYSHVSLFSLLAAPLLIGCPIEQLDDFTLNLLTNDEIIAVNQDPLGRPARLLVDEGGFQVWVKPLEDGSYAAGLFNIDGFGATPQSYFRWGDESARSFLFDFAKAGLPGKWRLKDLWRQQDLGVFNGSFSAEIPHHGVKMLRMTREN